VTITPTATPLPTPTVRVLTQEEIDQSYQEQLANIAETSGLTAAQYRQLFVNDLLRAKLVEALGDQMPTTGERVQASHILLSVPEDASDAVEQETLARAISITQELKNGADFATLAEQYSDDPGSAANGGDLGFFGRGMMVPEFEEAAYALDVGQISEPVRSQFGYHIIEVTAKDQGEPDFDQWFQDRKTAAAIERRLTNARLPALPAVNPALLQQPVQPAALPTAAPAPAEQ
jgi:parvulin-like peptidyl-prolyl isomerase